MSVVNRNKTKVVSISIDLSIYEKAKQLSKDDNRPFSNYVETLILRDIDEKSKS